MPFLVLVYDAIGDIADDVDCGHYGFTGKLVALDRADISEQYPENPHKVTAVSHTIRKEQMLLAKWPCSVARPELNPACRIRCASKTILGLFKRKMCL